MNASQGNSNPPSKKDVSYRPLHDSEGYDEVLIRVVPRFKTSELSGDEWRISAVVTVKRKGIIVYERAFGKMEQAAQYLSWVTGVEMTEMGPPRKRGLFGHYPDECAQPSCTNPPLNHYRIKKLFTAQGEGPLPESDYFEYRRAFCVGHSKRGDSDREDNDENYELVEGSGAKRVDPKAVREAQFGGVIDLRDKPKEDQG